MGNQTSNQNQNKKLSHTIQDQRYGGTISISQQKNKSIACRNLEIRSKQQQNSIINFIIKRSKLIHRNFITVRNYNTFKNEDFCSKYHGLNISIEYYENDLEKQIQRRASEKNYFSEEKILIFFSQIVDCLKFLQQRKAFHGDIKSANIFLDKNERIKLLDSYFIHLGKSNFELVLSNPNNLAYLSPQQLSNLRKGHYSQQDQNIYKNQIFSLGMTILEIMQLNNSFQCYQLTLLRILDDKIKQKLDEMRKKYSNDLVNLVANLLQLEQSKRPSYSQILNHPIMKVYNKKLSVSQYGSPQSRLNERKSIIQNNSKIQKRSIIQNNRKIMIDVNKHKGESRAISERKSK